MFQIFTHVFAGTPPTTSDIFYYCCVCSNNCIIANCDISNHLCSGRNTNSISNDTFPLSLHSSLLRMPYKYTYKLVLSARNLISVKLLTFSFLLRNISLRCIMNHSCATIFKRKRDMHQITHRPTHRILQF